MIPEKLRSGDKVAVIAPARSLAIISREGREAAARRFKELGLDVVYSRHAEEIDEFTSSSIASRLEDLHWAFGSREFKAVFTVIGGFNSNQLLSRIDYSIIKSNPKIFCGYSDITALSNAIYAKTGLVTYSGPHFSSFGMQKGFEYTLEGVKNCLISQKPFKVAASDSWSDDQWFRDQEKREFVKNNGCLTINKGDATGTIIGGNLCTFNLLQGTEFMPSLEGSILFIEDDELTRPYIFDRDLQSLIQQPGFDGVRGMVIGRFQRASEMKQELLSKIIKAKKELEQIPVICNADFGHTTPQITFPVGGEAELEASNAGASLAITKH